MIGPLEEEAGTIALLRALRAVFVALRQLTLLLTVKLERNPGDVEDESPEEGTRLVVSRLRCMIQDQMDPSIETLEEMIEEIKPEAQA